MASAVFMPKLGLTMEVGTVIRWLRKKGDAVRAGEVLCQVETDKIAADVESPQDGFLLEVLVAEGAEAGVQAVLAVVGAQGEDVAALAAASPSAASPSAAASAASPAAGPTAEVPAAAAAPAAGSAVEPEAPGQQTPDRDGPRVSPRARKMMAEKGLSREAFAGFSGERITEADVLELLARRAGSSPSSSTRGAAAMSGIRPMSRIEKIVAARMTESFRDIPQFSVRVTIEMDRLLTVFPAGSVGVNALVLRAVALSLSRSPEVQCQYRPEGIYSPSAVNMGFAVAVGRDLMVPVIHSADRKRLREIEQEAALLAEKAKAGALSPDDLAEGTFTVSNLGMFGITSFTPIVNPGQGAILGVGVVQSIPRVREGAVVPASILELTLACDHRSVNGAAAAEFCRTLKGIIESEEASSW